VAILLLVLLLPSVGHPPTSEAAAAQLREIAANAASQPALQLGNGQWLLTDQQVSFFAQVSQVGSTPTPEAQATVSATIKEWSNSLGQSCASSTSGPAQFATPANEAAWQAAGLLDIPNTQPVTSCTSVEGATDTNGLGQGTGVIDVSGLPTNPSILAQELETGTTGISGLDQVSSLGQNPGFERAAILLIGPTTGGTPAFNAALYDAVAMIPGVDALGQVTTHSGATGLGFAANSVVGRSVIVIDPTTGALLEAREIADQGAFQGLSSAYLAPPPTQGIGSEGGSYRVIIQWLDPIGSPSVVGAGSLPPGLELLPAVPETGTIAATENPGVTEAQLTSLEAQLRVRYGEPASQSYLSPALKGTSSLHAGVSVDWSFTGPTSQIGNYATALRASGLFSSVVVQYEVTSP